MPKNTQMHMQWITVNGQSVPLVLPQYWDGEKWVISSEQNPLPVKAELTGSNVEYVGSILQADELINYSIRYYGTNTKGGAGAVNVTPVNYKRFSKKMIIVENNFDVSINLTDISFFSSASSNNFITNVPLSNVVTIVAGGTAVLSSVNDDTLSHPIPAIAVRITRSTAPTSGSINIHYFGGV